MENNIQTKMISGKQNLLQVILKLTQTKLAKSMTERLMKVIEYQ